MLAKKEISQQRTKAKPYEYKKICLPYVQLAVRQADKNI